LHFSEAIKSSEAHRGRCFVRKEKPGRPLVLVEGREWIRGSSGGKKREKGRKDVLKMWGKGVITS